MWRCLLLATVFCDASTEPSIEIDGSTILRDGVPWVPVGINSMGLYASPEGRNYPDGTMVVREYYVYYVILSRYDCYYVATSVSSS